MAAKAKRRKLQDFDCTHSHLGHGCVADDGACGWQERCPDVVIYREYLALRKCARLLEIYMRWKVRPLIKVSPKHSLGDMITRQSRTLHRLIRAALKEAGL